MAEHLLTPASTTSPPRAAWSQRLGVFDLETTGVDVAGDRIVTAHVGLIDADGRVIRAQGWLADPGVTIPDAAAAVHGVTTAHARAHGGAASRVAREVVEALRALFDDGIPVVAFNAPFDFTLLRHEALRHGVAPLEAPAPVIDPLVLDKALDKYRRGKRTLTAVAEHYGVTLEGAHEAAADAVAAGRVAQAIAAQDAAAGGAWATLTAAELHARQVEWAREQTDGLSEYFARIGKIPANEPLDGRWPVR